MPTLPRGLTETDFNAALDQFAAALGAEHVVTATTTSPPTATPTRRSAVNLKQRVASAAVAPASVEQVQQVVRIANPLAHPAVRPSPPARTWATAARRRTCRAA